MVQRNPHFQKLIGGYLFPEVKKRINHYLEKCPNADLINLSIGDTTEPLVETISSALKDKIQQLSTSNGYSGYGPEQGTEILRNKIAKQFYKDILPDEIYISDGAKCDIGRLQLLFGSQATIAVQDPSYPVYIDSSVIIGQTGRFDEIKKQYLNITYLPCLPENDFFPELEKTPSVDLIYFCNPNNPTGIASSFEQLERLVHFAKKNKSFIIFDAAYAHFIKDPKIPKSIYEISGSKEVAIEVNSFSKMAGFTGIRLGWTVIPHHLRFDDGSSVKSDWHRLITTLFNGASNISQSGGLAALTPEGIKEIESQQRFYLNNAALFKKALEKKGYILYGGSHAPFLWAKGQGKESSWELFEKLIAEYQIVSTPGSGFGPCGEGFLRFSCFGKEETIQKAIHRILN